MGEFENTDRIDDELTVLDLLALRWGDSTTRMIDRRFRDGPYVEIRHWHDFGDDVARRFTVTDRVADSLLGKLMVEHKPRWGGVEKAILRISEFGVGLLWDLRARLKTPDRFTAERWFIEGRYVRDRK